MSLNEIVNNAQARCSKYTKNLATLLNPHHSTKECRWKQNAGVRKTRPTVSQSGLCTFATFCTFEGLQWPSRAEKNLPWLPHLWLLLVPTGTHIFLTWLQISRKFSPVACGV